MYGSEKYPPFQRDGGYCRAHYNVLEAVRPGGSGFNFKFTGPGAEGTAF